jgi:hypothetical protein
MSLGLLAQLAEQLTLNQRVVGSSPTRPTMRKPRPRRGFYFLKVSKTPMGARAFVLAELVWMLL